MKLQVILLLQLTWIPVSQAATDGGVPCPRKMAQLGRVEKALELAREEHDQQQEAERRETAKLRAEFNRDVEKYFGENGPFRNPMLAWAIWELFGDVHQTKGKPIVIEEASFLKLSYQIGDLPRETDISQHFLWRPRKTSETIVKFLESKFGPLVVDLTRPEQGTAYIKARNELLQDFPLSDAQIEAGIELVSAFRIPNNYSTLWGRNNEAVGFLSVVLPKFADWVLKSERARNTLFGRARADRAAKEAQEAFHRFLYPDQGATDTTPFGLEVTKAADTPAGHLALPSARPAQAALPAPEKSALVAPAPVHYEPMKPALATRNFEITPKTAGSVFAVELDNQLTDIARGFVESRAHFTGREGWADVESALKKILPKWRGQVRRADALRLVSPALVARAAAFEPAFHEMTQLREDAAALKSSYERAIETVDSHLRLPIAQDDIQAASNPQILSLGRRRNSLDRSVTQLEAMDQAIATSYQSAEKMAEMLLDLQALLSSSDSDTLSPNEITALRSLHDSIQKLPK